MLQSGFRIGNAPIHSQAFGNLKEGEQNVFRLRHTSTAPNVLIDVAIVTIAAIPSFLLRSISPPRLRLLCLRGKAEFGNESHDKVVPDDNADNFAL